MVERKEYLVDFVGDALIAMQDALFCAVEKEDVVRGPRWPGLEKSRRCKTRGWWVQADERCKGQGWTGAPIEAIYLVGWERSSM